jgi:DNA-binding transcriptional MerR regulator
MRMSELSRSSGVSVPTIKFYLREGLLPAGDAAGAANQAEYGAAHLHRLHLVRTLLQVGGLSIATARATLAAIDNEKLSAHDMLATAHNALPVRADTPTTDADVDAARADVDTWLVGLGWEVASSGVARTMLSYALLALRRLGRDVGPEVFAPYAELADGLAERELATMDPAAPRPELVEEMVIGTVVFESALVALRRLAHANHSSTRFVS